MSAKNVKGFFEKVESDKSLQAKLKTMHKKTIGECDAKLAQEVVEIAAAAGFKFTAKDFAKANAANRKKLSAGAMADVRGQELCLSQNYGCGSSWYCNSGYY